MKKQNKSEEKELYLDEDKDLMTELDSIGPLSTGQPLEEQKKRVQVVQIKATLRSRKSFDDFDKATNRYTILLIAFALIQIFIGLFQFLFDATTSEKKWWGFLTVVILTIMILLVLKSFNKILKDK